MSLFTEDAGEQAAFYGAVNAPFVGNGFTRWVDGQYVVNVASRAPRRRVFISRRARPHFECELLSWWLLNRPCGARVAASSTGQALCAVIGRFFVFACCSPAQREQRWRHPSDGAVRPSARVFLLYFFACVASRRKVRAQAARARALKLGGWPALRPRRGAERRLGLHRAHARHAVRPRRAALSRRHANSRPLSSRADSDGGADKISGRPRRHDAHGSAARRVGAPSPSPPSTSATTRVRLAGRDKWQFIRGVR